MWPHRRDAKSDLQDPLIQMQNKTGRAWDLLLDGKPGVPDYRSIKQQAKQEIEPLM